MHMNFSVRRATFDDLPMMCALLCELFSMESDFSPDKGKQSRGLKLLLADTSGASIILVADRGDEIVGMCTVQTLISTAEGGPVGLLEDLIVRKDHRGNGIGTRLLCEIYNWCVMKSISRIQLLRDTENISALNFYAGNDWDFTNLVCMRKML
jgi:GNAT superfamily N-acetyltransferase